MVKKKVSRKTTSVEPVPIKEGLTLEEAIVHCEKVRNDIEELSQEFKRRLEGLASVDPVKPIDHLTIIRMIRHIGDKRYVMRSE